MRFKLRSHRNNNIDRQNYNHFFFKKKTNYRISKRIKHQSKIFRERVVKRFCTRPMGLVELFVKLGIYKDILLLKLIFILVPFIILFLLDNAIIATIIATIDIFCCAIIFSTTVTEKKEAIIDKEFNYDLYKSIKYYKETRAILIMFFISMVLTLIGHFLMKSFLIGISGIAIE